MFRPTGSARLLCLATVAATLTPCAIPAAEPQPGAHGLVLAEFAHEPMVQNPVAVTVDEHNRVYVTSVVRRQAADLDIRRFTEWIPTDLSLTSVDQKRAFFQRELTPANSAKYAGRFEDTNGDGSFDWRDLSRLTDRISRLTDTDGDGVADQVVTFDAATPTVITGIAAGLAAWDGALYATVEPDILKLVDRDGDGTPDERTVLASGFSLHVGYGGHNFSGPIIGPDGRLYVSVADRGMNVTTADGHAWANPYSGAIARCEFDGSGFEIFATGLRNLQEPAFDALGNILGVDNDGDMPGEKERFVFVPEGSDSGWRTYWQYRGDAYQPWLAEGLSVPPHPGQPAYLFPPNSLYVDGPAGFAFNPGTALNDHYRDYFFLTAFPSRNLFAFRAEPDGATFKMVDDHLVANGVLMVGMSFGADGALYLADWSSDGYAMNEKGGVWKLDDPREAGSVLRRRTAELLASDWSQPTPATLAGWLAHPDQRVRLKAQFELVRRTATADLFKAAAAPAAPRLARVHAIWGLGQLLRHGQIAPDAACLAWLSDTDPEIRAQAAKVLGEATTAPAALIAALRANLADPADHARFFAAIALGRLHAPAAVPDLLAYLARDGADPYHRHAIVMGLTGCATAEQLAALAHAPSTAVRLGAIVALRRQASPRVQAFLADADPLVVAEAASAIQDDASIEPALPAVAALLAHPSGQLERTIRRALAAAVRLRSADAAATVAAFASDDAQPKHLRLLALDLLRTWPEPPRLDSVQGRFRELAAVPAATIAPAVEPALTTLSQANDFDLAQAAWATAAPYGLLRDPAHLTAIVEQDTAMAAAALSALNALAPPSLLDVVRRALRSAHAPVRGAALTVLATRASAEFGPAAAAALDRNDVTEIRAALAVLPTLPAALADPVRRLALQALTAGSLPPAVALDVLEAAGASENTDLTTALAAYQATKDAADPLAPYLETLAGGDATRGRTVFETSVTAQCTLCHRVTGEGSHVGPKLEGVGAKPPRYLLESLIIPGAVVVDGYGFSTVTLRNGESVSGTLMATNHLHTQLRLADGTLRDFARADITDQTPAMSAMPPMGTLMPKTDLRDLLAFLQTLQPRPKRPHPPTEIEP